MILNEFCFGVRLLRDITYEDSYPSISKFISNAFSTSIIEKKQFVFNNFYPVESSKIYKKNKIYWITLRSIDPNIKDILLNVYSNDFEVVNHNIKEIHPQRINRLYTITPVVVTLKDGRFWTKEYDINLLIDALHSNLEKKYNLIFNTTKKADNFIKKVEILNKAPYKVYGRNKIRKFNFLGNKLRIHVKNDDFSQELANLALAGIGEKNSFGCGFVAIDKQILSDINI